MTSISLRSDELRAIHLRGSFAILRFAVVSLTNQQGNCSIASSEVILINYPVPYHEHGNLYL